MQVKSSAECSKGSILQSFQPSLSYHLLVRSLFCLLLSGCLRHALLYWHPTYTFVFVEFIDLLWDGIFLLKWDFFTTKKGWVHCLRKWWAIFWNQVPFAIKTGFTVVQHAPKMLEILIQFIRTEEPTRFKWANKASGYHIYICMHLSLTLTCRAKDVHYNQYLL